MEAVMLKMEEKYLMMIWVMAKLESEEPERKLKRKKGVSP